MSSLTHSRFKFLRLGLNVSLVHVSIQFYISKSIELELMACIEGMAMHGLQRKVGFIWCAKFN